MSTRLLSTALIGFSFVLLSAPLAHGVESSTETAKPEKIDVDELRKKYWDQGEIVDLRVIQNRLYKKSQRFELGTFFGKMSTDPFLAVTEYGFTFSYHFSEYIGLGVVKWFNQAKPSAALSELELTTHKTAPTNPQKELLGGEIQFSPVYGKLSLWGRAIIHYDLHLLGGVGEMTTQNGKFIAPILGIGQELYLGKHAALRLDYRYLWYRETLISQTTLGPVSRTAGCDVITLGFNLLFGLWN